jgi:hypothetical protein
MKIEKIIKKVGIIVGIVGSLFGVYMFLTQLKWMIADRNFTMVLGSIGTIAQSIIFALFIYGFGEIIELLSKINENLQDK